MKKVISILLCIMLVLSVAPLSAFAIDTYDLWVGGVRVTSENASAITGEGISGNASYNAETATLTLEGATLTGLYCFNNKNEFYAAVYSAGSLTVELIGDNRIESVDIKDSFSYNGIYSDANLTVCGSGSLIIDGTKTSRFMTGLSGAELTVESGSIYVDSLESNKFATAIQVQSGDLTINGGNIDLYAAAGLYSCYGQVIINAGTVNVNAISYGIYSNYKTVINGGSVYAYGATNGIYTYTGIEIGTDVNEVIFRGGTNATIRYSDPSSAFTVADGIETTYSYYADGEVHPQQYNFTGSMYYIRWMRFAKPDTNAINIWFGGVQLNDSNIGDLTAMLNEKHPGSASGTASLVRATDTSPAVLTLDNFSYEGSGGGTIRDKYTYTALEVCEDLVINVNGDCSVKYIDGEGNECCAILTNTDCALTITGDGTMSFTGGYVTDPQGYGMTTRGMVLCGPLTVSGNINLIGTGADDCNVSIGCSLYSNLTLEGNATILFTGGTVDGSYCSSKGMACNTTNPVTFNFTDSWCGSFTANGQTQSFDDYGTLVLEGQDIDVVGYYNGGGDRDILPERRNFGEFSYNLKIVITPYLEKQPIYVSGIRVTEKNYSDILGDGGTVSYNKATNTLTLNNANIQSDGDRDCMQDINGIQFATDSDYNSQLTLNIKAIGTNTVKGASVDNSYPTCGFYTGSRNSTIYIELVDGATLNFVGGNSDKCQHGSFGINANNSKLNIIGKGTLNAIGGNAAFSSCVSSGMRLGSETVIDGDVTVNASSGTAGDYSYSCGISCVGSPVLTLKGNSVITCSANTESNHSLGFNLGEYDKNITLNVSDWQGSMTCTGGEYGFTAAYGYSTVQSTQAKLVLDDYVKTELYPDANDSAPAFSQYINGTRYINTDALVDEYAIGDVQKVVFTAYKGFPDVKEGSWYYDAVKYSAIKGFIGGYATGMFGPADSLKRQDFVLIIARIAGADLSKYADTQSKLTDVKKGAYYAAAVNWAVDSGIIAGYNNGKFGVNDPITREQVATILYRYMGSPDVDNVDSTLSKFSDVKKISAYAKIPIAWAVQNGVISGMADGRAAPVEGASRAQIAQIVMRMDEQGMFKS